MPETNNVLPETNIVLPETNVVLPETNVVLPETNIILPETTIVLPETNDVLPEKDKFTILNDNTVDLKFYLAHKLDSPKGLFVTVAAGDTKTFPVSDLGILTNRYVMVENDSLTTNGHFTFTFND